MPTMNVETGKFEYLTKLAKIEALARNIRFDTDYLEDSVSRSHIIHDVEKILAVIREEA